MDQLVKYMIDVAMGMHYIAEKGLIHRVCVYIHVKTWQGDAIYPLFFLTWSNRALLQGMWWWERINCVKWQTLVFCVSYPQMTLSMVPLPISHAQCDGWPLKALKTAHSQPPLMPGPLESCSGRCSTPTGCPTRTWRILSVQSRWPRDIDCPSHKAAPQLCAR